MSLSKIKYIPFLLLLLLTGTLPACKDEEPLPVFDEATGSPSGTAIIITGAAARITQELALLEALDNQGLLDDVRFISGVSSGAINTVMINAVLDESNDFEWEDYKDIVLNLEQSDVLVNDNNNLPVNTQPLWRTFDRTFKEQLGFQTMQDLPISSAVTAAAIDLQGLVSASNVPELSTFDGDITEVIMASASFPVAFPSIKIGDNIYVDGGLQENIPVSVALQFQLIDNIPFERIYIVSYQKNRSMDWGRELSLLGVERTRKDLLEISLKRAGFNTDQLSEASFNKNLELIQQQYPQFASRTMVFVPAIEDLPYYGVFDFNNQTARESYDRVSTWAQSNSPLPLSDYLDQ
ncbi:MAG: patatin-like phospholipase family protein [Bacteroidota bacterium]